MEGREMNYKNFFTSEGTWRVRDNGRIELRMYYRDTAGNTRRKSFSGIDLKECYAKAETFSCEYTGFICRSDSTIPDILRGLFESDLKMNFVKRQTYETKMGHLKILEKHLIGHIPIVSVSKEIIDDCFATLSFYSSSTIESLYLLLKQAFKIATEEGIIQKNIMMSRDIRRPKSRKNTKKVMAFTPYEQTLIEADIMKYKAPYGSNDHRYQLLLQLYTGMRVGEVNALKVEDIDLESNVIHIRRTLIKINKQYVIGDTTKTPASVRDIPISTKARGVLKLAIKEMHSNDDGLLFYDKKRETVINPLCTSSALRRSCMRCGIDPRSSHALRHTFATRCIEAGVPAVVLKKWLGHTDIHVTLDTYADVFDKMHNDAIDKFDEYINSLK